MAAIVSRRTALKFAGLITLAAHNGFPFPVGAATPSAAAGYGSDPNLLQRPVPWSRTLSAQQLAALAVLCDIVLPAEPPHPAASKIGVHDFLDEWVSAPYPRMQADGAVIVSGLAMLEEAARRDGSTPFAQLDTDRQITLFDDSCGTPATEAFARRLIELVCDGYYTTREGHNALGYVGNVALASFPGTPPEVMRHLESALEQLPPPPAASDTPALPPHTPH